jgi:opacity protein-like surface antigen
MITRIAVLTSTLVLGTCFNAFAQNAWEDRLFVNVSVGAQPAERTSSASLTQVIYDEAASVTLGRDFGGGTLFDVTIGRPIVGNLGVAVSISGVSSEADGDLTGSIPDPIFFDSPRSVSGAVADLAHSETWIGILAAWRVPVGERLDVIALAGPAFARVAHDVALDFDVTETGGTPGVSVSLDSVSKTFTGIQVGADVRYMFTDLVGAGGFLRFTRASGDIVDGTDITVGGVQVGVGVRLKF